MKLKDVTLKDIMEESFVCCRFIFQLMCNICRSDMSPEVKLTGNLALLSWQRDIVLYFCLQKEKEHKTYPVLAYADKVTEKPVQEINWIVTIVAYREKY